MSYETQSHKTHHETLKFQENLLPLQTNNVQAMLPLSERMSGMHFSAIWRLKLQKTSLWCPPWEHLTEKLTKQTVQKLKLWRKTAVDKSAWIKACKKILSRYRRKTESNKNGTKNKKRLVKQLSYLQYTKQPVPWPEPSVKLSCHYQIQQESAHS